MSTNDSRPTARISELSLLTSLVVLLLGLWMGSHHELGNYLVETDFYGIYGPGAERVSSGLSYDAHGTQPGYSLLLVALSFLFDDVFVIAKVVSAVSLAVAGRFVFLTIRAIATPQVGLLTQVMFSIALFRYSFIASTDLFFLALTLGALYFLLRDARPTAGALLVAGSLSALAFFTRLHGVALLAAAGLSLVSFLPARERFATRVRNLLVYATGAAVLAVPFLVANHRWHGYFVDPTAASWFQLPKAAEPAEGEDVRFVLGVVAPPVGSVAQGMYDRANRGLADAVFFPEYLFLGAGILVLLFHPLVDRRRVYAYWLYAVIALGIAFSIRHQARYYYPILPMVYLPIAAALLHDWGEGGRTVFGRRVRAATITIALATLFAITAVKTRQDLQSEPVELLEVGAVLQQHATPEHVVVARKPHLAYVAGVRDRRLKPKPTLASFLQWLRNSDADYLYVGPQEANEASYLRPLARGESVPEGLALLHRTASPPSALYALRDPSFAPEQTVSGR